MRASLLLVGCCVAAAVATGGCAKQPPATCRVAPFWLPYAMTMKPTSTSPSSCAPNDTTTEFMSFEHFSGDPTLKGKFPVSFVGGDIANSTRPDTSGAPARGMGSMPFDSKDGLCAFTNEVDSSAHYDAIEEDVDAGIAGQPATSVRYSWKSLEFVSTARALGTLMRGELVKTVDGCAVTYAVTGISPPVSCEVNEDCLPFTNPDGGRPSHKSGIAPELTFGANNEQILVCVGGGLDEMGNPTGICQPDYSKTTFEKLVEAAQ